MGVRSGTPDGQNVFARGARHGPTWDPGGFQARRLGGTQGWGVHPPRPPPNKTKHMGRMYLHGKPDVDPQIGPRRLGGLEAPCLGGPLWGPQWAECNCGKARYGSPIGGPAASGSEAGRLGVGQTGPFRDLTNIETGQRASGTFRNLTELFGT